MKADPVAQLAEAVPEAPPIQVLLIEDDLVDEMATLRTISGEGLPYRVQVARSLAQARSVLAVQAFDVILADFQLRDGSSFDLMDAFAEQVVIFVTGAWDEAAAALALRLGVHDYLIKDQEGKYLKLLAYRVETALRQRRLARRLRDSEARLQAILDHAPAAISAHDLAGQLILSNRFHGAMATLPTSAGELLPSPHAPLESEETLTHSDGSQRTYLTVRFPMVDDQGRSQAVGEISVDITTRKKAEQLIRNLAYFDPLTGLPNRRMLLDRFQQAFATSARHGGHGAVFFIDLDHFKALNDALGHDHGDLLLAEVAARLLACVRGEDTVARIGGDEFVVMTVSLDGDAQTAVRQAATVGEKILAAVSRPCLLGAHTHSVTPSIGVSLFLGRDVGADELIKRADVAMYQSKAAGRGAVRFFDPVMQTAIDNRASLDGDLRQAVGAGQLVLHFQGMIDAQRGAVGAEALLRWHHPQRGLLLPGQFLPLAVQTGQIVPIGLWVIDQACAQLARWARDPRRRHLRLAVNISAREFGDDDFVSRVLQALRTHGTDPTQLRLELRESLVQDRPEQTLARMQTLRATGVGFVMDDYGVSFSSLSHLKRLPLDQIKISQSLILSMMNDPHDDAIVNTIIGIARGMGLGASAAGVETVQQRDHLLALGCSQWQGNYFGQPAPLAQFESLLNSVAFVPRPLPLPH